MSTFWSALIGPLLIATAPAIANPAPILASTTNRPIYLVGTLRITTPMLRVVTEDPTRANAFFTVENRGSSPDRLIGATIDSADAAKLATASSVVAEGTGMDIQPGQKLNLAPDAMHLALNGLRGPLKQGEQVHGTLSFERAGSMPIDFIVEDQH